MTTNIAMIILITLAAGITIITITVKMPLKRIIGQCPEVVDCAPPAAYWNVPTLMWRLRYVSKRHQAALLAKNLSP
jgi:hypothetical protein